MKFVYSYNTRENERREGLTVSARNREAAFAKLNRQGIRPCRLQPAPGLWNKVLSIGGRGLTIVLLALALLAALLSARALRRNIEQLERDDGVREILAEAISSQVRRQPIGDQGEIDRGIRTGWADVFEHRGERFLASFAVPGVPAAVRTTDVAAIEAALARKIEASDGDSIETRQIKAMVEGMKDELRRFVAAGGTIEQYGRRLAARQDDEIAIRARASNEIGQAVRGDADRDAVAELVDRRNEELRRMGIRPIAMPDLTD